MSLFTHHQDADFGRRKRALRVRIARRRRRINQRIGAMSYEGRRLVSWRTYVAHYPVATLAAAFGVGLMAAVAFRPTAWTRRLGTHLIGSAWGAISADLRREFRRAAVSLIQSRTRPPEPTAAEPH